MLIYWLRALHLVCCLCGITLAFAAAKPIDSNYSLRLSPVNTIPGWYLDLGIGSMIKEKANTSYIANEDEEPDEYKVASLKPVPLASVAAGYLWVYPRRWLPLASLGLAYNYQCPSTIKGIINDYSDSGEANVGYQYQVAHQSLQLVSKTNIYHWHHWLPYVAAGLGVSWNQFSAYDEQAITKRTTEHANPHFPNKTKPSLSYSLAIGVDYHFTKHWWGGLGYRYNYWGQLKSGYSTIVAESLKTRLQGQQVFFSLRYLLG